MILVCCGSVCSCWYSAVWVSHLPCVELLLQSALHLFTLHSDSALRCWSRACCCQHVCSHPAWALSRLGLYPCHLLSLDSSFWNANLPTSASRLGLYPFGLRRLDSSVSGAFHVVVVIASWLLRKSCLNLWHHVKACTTPSEFTCMIYCGLLSASQRLAARPSCPLTWFKLNMESLDPFLVSLALEVVDVFLIKNGMVLSLSWSFWSWRCTDSPQKTKIYV